MRVYLVRHGETLHNRERRFQGLQVPLSSLGREQAMETAELLPQCSADTILTSDLTRAKETADIISDRLGIDVEISPLLAEIRRPRKLWGRWHYHPVSLFIMGLSFLHAGNHTWHYSDEENPFDHYTRCAQAKKHIEARTEEHLIVVTHRVTLTMLLTLMRGNGRCPNLYRFAFSAYLNNIKNASITVCDWDGERWHIAAFDRAQHLQHRAG